MSGIAILVDLLKTNSGFSSQALQSCGLLSATVAASAAAATVSSGRPFGSSFLFSNGGLSVAFSDAGVIRNEDYISSQELSSEKTFYQDALKYSTKDYPVELKPLFSAFGIKALAMTSIRSFLLFYLPLLEPQSHVEEDEDEQPKDQQEKPDYSVPLKKSVKQIIRETTVVTTRRVLERLCVHYVSRRTAWKLLKDIPRSAKRKAERGMPSLVFCCNVSRSTFRGHFLGVAASWLVQIGVEIYRCFSFVSNDEDLDRSEKLQVLRKRVSSATVKCGFSLVFASIGAGIGAVLIRPSSGQWIGCAVGDFAGPMIATICFDKFLHIDL